MILVTGAAGRVGRGVVSALRDSGIEFRAFVRDEAQRAMLGPIDSVVVGDLDDPIAVSRALLGIDALFLVTPATADQMNRECRLLDAAVAANVGRVIKVSVLGASPEAQFRFGRGHAAIEEYLRNLPILWTMLRPNRFFHTVLGSMTSIDRGYFIGCHGEGAVSMVDLRDFASAAVVALADERLIGQTIELTGEQAITFGQQAEILSQSLEREVRYIDVAPDDMRSSLREAGMSDWLAEAIIELGLFYKEGTAAKVSGDIREITGTGPRTFAQWCDDNKEKFGSISLGRDG